MRPNSDERQRGGAFSILMLDLDRFKNVNDSLGHAAGDALLRQVALRLKSALRSTDALARLGGDEFAIIQAECDDQRTGSIDLATRISRLIAEPFLLQGHQVEVGTSIGIAMAPEHGSDQEQLLKKADLACIDRNRPAGTALLSTMKRCPRNWKPETRWKATCGTPSLAVSSSCIISRSSTSRAASGVGWKPLFAGVIRQEG